MVRLNTKDAAVRLEELVDRVERGGESVELTRDSRVVARIIPSATAKASTAAAWNELFESLPHLGDDADAFGRDIEGFRQSLPPVVDPWA